MAFFSSLHFLHFLLFLHHALHSSANLHKTSNLLKSYVFPQPSNDISIDDDPPTRFFEVTRPIPHSKAKLCSYTVLQHDFGFTYGKPPVLTNYSLPSCCTSYRFTRVVLEWTATCRGRQFDRIFGVWLGGVELLRSCTAEPTPSGIVWTVEKDVTKYRSLLVKEETQTLAVYLGNIVDRTYTGVYHVNLTFHFYPAELGDSNADMILPISRDLPLNDALWFQIQNSADIKSKTFKIPPNVYRAVLEVYVSFHENDEFWYANLPSDFIVANDLDIKRGNGPFREVVVTLDDEVVGAVWPFTVIYTGGINPHFWRPISGIGSFNLPSYDIDITPLLGKLLDGKMHRLGFGVTNALNVWFVDANLHLWVDRNCPKTEAGLLEHNSSPASFTLVSKFVGLNGTFLSEVHRSISSTGWVKSSYGNITTSSVQEFGFHNSMFIGEDGNLQSVGQMINLNSSEYTKWPFGLTYFVKSCTSFPLTLYTYLSEQGDNDFVSTVNFTLGFNENRLIRDSVFWFLHSSLVNMQKGQVVIVVKNNLVVKNSSGMTQVYKYRGSDLCYFRNISSSNGVVVYDKVVGVCEPKGEEVLSSAPGKDVTLREAFDG